MTQTPWFDSHGSLTINSFERIYKKLALPLTKFIAKKIGADQETVEEVFEETIVAGWKGFKAFRHKSSYFTWLCRIALNKIADYYRDQVNIRSRIIVPALKDISNLESGEISPEERLALHELKLMVNQCLDLLPPEKRELLHLRYWKEFTLAQIARSLGISEKAAEGRVYRARLAFAKVARKKYLI